MEARLRTRCDLLVLDAACDWSSPSPATSRLDVQRWHDSTVWDDVAAHGPAWVNAACYPLTDGRFVAVMAVARAGGFPEPAVARSAALAGAILRLVD